MMHFRNLSVKLSVFVSVVLVIVIGTFAFLNIRSQRNLLIEEVMHGACLLSDIVKRSTKRDMLEFHRERLYETIESIGEQEGIERVRIFNKEGMIIFSTDKKEVGNLIDKQGEACFTCHTEEEPLKKLTTSGRTRIFRSKDNSYRVLGMISPIYNEKQCYTADCHAHPKEQNVLGVLDLSMSLENLDFVIKRNMLTIIGFTLSTILIISILIGFFIYRYVNEPIRKLLVATQDVAVGKLDRPITIRTHDEIGELAYSFGKMTEELKKASKSFQLAVLGRLAAEVAHEVNNPLTTILGFCTVLLENKEKDDPEREDLQTVIDETIRCREIIKGIMNLAKQSKPEKRKSNINNLIKKTIPLVKHKISFYNIKITKELLPRLPDIMIDERQIQQIFINILLNASESMPKGGRIHISSHATEDGFIAVRFADTGCGIDKENIDRIFDPFFTTRETGTGLGLAISREIIGQHGGDMKVKSKKGKGTTFTIRFPMIMKKSELAAKKASNDNKETKDETST